jgi:hypothetical protein
MLSRVKETVGGAWERRSPALRPRPRSSRAAAEPPAPDRSAELRELRAQRDRLVEKFTIMEADLGGAFYEMAIRDHVRLDVLTRKAAELQRVDQELTAIETTLQLERSDAAGICHACSAPFAPGTKFCSQCGTPLTSTYGVS